MPFSRKWETKPNEVTIFFSSNLVTSLTARIPNETESRGCLTSSCCYSLVKICPIGITTCATQLFTLIPRAHSKFVTLRTTTPQRYVPIKNPVSGATLRPPPGLGNEKENFYFKSFLGKFELPALLVHLLAVRQHLCKFNCSVTFHYT